MTHPSESAKWVPMADGQRDPHSPKDMLQLLRRFSTETLFRMREKPSDRQTFVIDTAFDNIEIIELY